MPSLRNVILFVAAAAAAALNPRQDASCSSSKTPKCMCPPGTTLQQSTTRCHIKAKAEDVISIIGSYQNTTWFGHEPDFVSGPDNQPGGSRTLTGGTPGGPVQFTETLFIYEDDKKGGFTMAYELENGPVTYIDPITGEEGSYAGYWDYLETKALGSKQTRFDWRIYACFTPNELSGIEHFHEWALINVNDILISRGLSEGFFQEPFTIESFHA